MAASLALIEFRITHNLSVGGYHSHLRFLMERAASRVHRDQSLIEYDRFIRERAEVYGPGVMGYGDLEGINRYLGVGSLRSAPGVPGGGHQGFVSKINRKMSVGGITASDDAGRIAGSGIFVVVAGTITQGLIASLRPAVPVPSLVVVKAVFPPLKVQEWGRAGARNQVIFLWPCLCGENPCRPQ